MSLMNAVRQAVWATDVGVALALPGALEDRISQRLYAGPRFAFLPMAIFGCLGLVLVTGGVYRSEEHTSELQSRGHLVCRLLLETLLSISRSPLFPYTTLFRSNVADECRTSGGLGDRCRSGSGSSGRTGGSHQSTVVCGPPLCLPADGHFWMPWAGSCHRGRL